MRQLWVDTSVHFSLVYCIDLKLFLLVNNNNEYLIFQALDPDSGLWGEVKYSMYGSGADL